jgi:anion-transporting  ArsA/GET3 family ATPase
MMNLEQFKGYIPPAVNQYIFQLKAELQELRAIRKEQAEDIQELEAENRNLTIDYVGLERQEAELESENKRLLETLEEIISCAENVLITYADTNQHIIDMARQARKEAGDD